MLLLFILKDLVFGNWGVDWKKLWHPVTLFWNDEAKMTAVVISCPKFGFSSYGRSFNQLLLSWQHNPEVLFSEKRKFS